MEEGMRVSYGGKHGILAIIRVTGVRIKGAM